MRLCPDKVLTCRPSEGYTHTCTSRQGRREEARVEVLTMGRIGVDLYPLQVGVPLEEVETFGKFLGGSPTNVAVAAARYGRRSAVITRTGDDPFGDYLHDALRGFGVDDRFVTACRTCRRRSRSARSSRRTTSRSTSTAARPRPTCEIRADELDLDAIRAAGHLLGDGHRPVPGAEPRRPRSPRCEARGKRGITVLDLDYRPMFWPSREEAHARGRRGAAARHRRRRQPRRVRDRGRRARAAAPPRPRCSPPASSSPSSSRARKGVLAVGRRRTSVEVPPVPVEVVNGLGAGDAFGGALCHGLLAGWDLERIDAVRQRRRRDRRRRGWPAPTPCRPPTRSKRKLRGGRPCVSEQLRRADRRPGCTGPERDRRGRGAPRRARRRCSASTAG